MNIPRGSLPDTPAANPSAQELVANGQLLNDCPHALCLKRSSRKKSGTARTALAKAAPSSCGQLQASGKFTSPRATAKYTISCTT
jgi:hypothetical protein